MRPPSPASTEPPEARPPLPERGRWSDQAWAGLCDLLARPTGGVAALDWDETCICGDISYALLDDLATRALVDPWIAYRDKIAADRLLAYRELAIELLAGRTPAEVRAWTRRVYEAGLGSGKLRRVPEMESLIRALLLRGWSVYVVTGSAGEVVATLARELGLPRDRVLGMDAVLGADGRFTDTLIEPVTWREGKTANLLARAGGPPDLAIGDSEGDIHLLESAGCAVWIDRGDPELSRVAKERAWWRQGGW